MKTLLRPMGHVALLAAMVLAGPVACKKKKKGDGGGAAGEMAPDMSGGMANAMDGMTPDKTTKTPPKAAGVFDLGLAKRMLQMPAKQKPVFKKVKQALLEAGSTCEKEKRSKTFHRFCTKWKGLRELVDKVGEKLDKKKPGTIARAKAVALAGIATLDKGTKYAVSMGTEVVGTMLAHFHEKGLNKHPFSVKLERVLAAEYKREKDADVRKHIIFLLGCSGRRAKFSGTAASAKALHYAAGMDEDKWVREEALKALQYCAHTDCKVTKDQVKAWYQKETNKGLKRMIARVAARIGMEKKALKWCEEAWTKGLMHWPCQSAIKWVATKDNLAQVIGWAEAYSKDAKSQKKGNWRLKMEIDTIIDAAKKTGFDQGKLFAFLAGVLKQPKNPERSAETTLNIVSALGTLGKEQAKPAIKLLKAQQGRYVKAWKKDAAAAKKWKKLVKDTIKILKDKK